MNWKKEAENDLRSYMRRKDSLQNIQDKIASLDDRMQSIRGGMSDATPVQGGESRAGGKRKHHFHKSGMRPQIQGYLEYMEDQAEIP